MKTQTKSYRSEGITVFWYVILIALFLTGLNFVAGELKYYGLEEQTFGKFWGVKWWLIGHLSGGIVALLTGPFQFWTRLRNKYIKTHRLMGKIYLTAIAVSALSSIYMAWNTALKTHFTWALSLQVLGFTWIVTSVMAYRAIKLRRIQQHKEWMIRSYIVTFAFVGFRWLNNTLGDAGIGTFVERAPTLIYLTIFIPLFTAEIVFQWNKK